MLCSYNFGIKCIRIYLKIVIRIAKASVVCCALLCLVAAFGGNVGSISFVSSSIVKPTDREVINAHHLALNSKFLAVHSEPAKGGRSQGAGQSAHWESEQEDDEHLSGRRFSAAAICLLVISACFAFTRSSSKVAIGDGLPFQHSPRYLLLQVFRI